MQNNKILKLTIIILIPVLGVFLYKQLTPAKVVEPKADAGVEVATSGSEPTPTPIPPKLLITEEQCNIECEDCKFFPVSKSSTLRSDYIPQVVPSGLPGGREVREEVRESLVEIFAKAKSEGVNLSLTSGYRSYATQEGLFNSYVERELGRNPGITRERAAEIANIYSARPGQSEHQLGTTVDITCVGCTPFNNSAGNLKVYEFLRNNVTDFGFVVSYPDGTTDVTGYKYEAWHIRYVGKEIASEYSKKAAEVDGKLAIETFLKEECSKNEI